MNWIGGARARAKLREQFNVRGNRRNTRLAHPDFRAVDEETSNQQSTSAGVGGSENTTDGQGAGAMNHGVTGTTRTNLKRSFSGRKETFSKDFDYSSLGYTLTKAEKFQRRSVPLLEFVEKHLPNGHILSLHLSHVVDITKPNFNESLRNPPPPPPRSSSTNSSSNVDTNTSAEENGNIEMEDNTTT